MTETGRVALVTGAGSGIGRAVAGALCRAGWHVVLAGRRAEALAETAAMLDRSDGGTPIPVDVSDERSVAELFMEIEARFGRLDLLLNNAGTWGPIGPIETVSLADWQRTIDVNLTGTWLCARAAFDLMKRQQPGGGRIINNGSVSSRVPRPESAAYTATKHAITGLTKSFSLDGRPFDIACGQIDIGNAATEMLHAAERGLRQADGSMRPEPTMAVSDVVSAVLCMTEMPLTANVQFMTVLATTMPYIGRG